ncbi:MAG: tetratricopeptide repeat protein [Chthoniobacterales bacterium]
MRSKRLSKRKSELVRSRLTNSWRALGLLLLTLLAYQPAWHGQPIWDDEAHMTKPELRSLGGLARIWAEPGATQQYYPVVHSVFWIEHKLWGDAVLPYHLVNILVHVGVALLLVRLLRELALPGAWLAGAIFALHPVHVESVAWISELKNTLSGVCALGAAVIYLRFDESRRTKLYAAAFALFSLGVLAKTVIATVPAALLVVFWWQRDKLSWRRDILPLLPFFAAGLAASFVTIWMERTQIGAVGSDFQFSFVERCLIAGRAFWFYIAKLLWPAKLTFVYPRWQISAGAWWQYLFPFAAAALLALLWLVRRKMRWPLAATLIFGGMLVPAFGFVNVYPFIYSFVADHFQYLASTAMISLGAAGLTLLAARWRVPLPAIAAVLLATFATLTWTQSRSYANAETLYRDTLARNPSAWMAHNNLANILVRSDRTAEAIPQYRAALQLRPKYLEARYNLGNALLHEGEVDGAIAECKAAIAIDSRSVEAHNNLANALRQKGAYADAIAHYETALALQPHVVATENNLAWLLATCRDVSLRDVKRALELATLANEDSGGSNPVVLHTLSAAYVQNGDFARGLTTAERALHLAEANRDRALAEILQREIGQIKAYLSAPR